MTPSLVWIGALVGLLVMFVAGCASEPTVSVDRDPSVNLRTYKTFAFFDTKIRRGLLPPPPLPGSTAHGDPFGLPPIIEPPSQDSEHYTALQTRHLQRAVRDQMERQGYVYDEAHPDLRVNAALHVDEKFELYTTPGALGYVGLGGAVNSYYYKQGTLSVDLVDARRMALVWQGVAEGRIDTRAGKDPGAAIEAAVAQIFAAFNTGKDN